MRKVLKFFILFLLGLVIAIGLLINPLVNSILSEKLNSVRGNNITIESSSSLFNAFTGDLVIDNLTIYQNENSLTITPNFKFSIENIQIFHMNMVSLISSGKLICDSILLEKPNFNFISFIKDSVASTQFIKKLSVDKVRVNNSSVLFNSRKELTCDSLCFELTNFDFPIDSNLSTSKISYGNFSCSANNINYTILKGMYRCQVGSFNLSSGNKSVYLNNLKVLPLYSKNSFAKVLGREAERITFNTQSISLLNFDLNTFLLSDSLLISKVIIDNYKVEVFKDKRLPRPQNLAVKPLPQEFLRNLKFSIKIDSVICSSGNILFEAWTMGAKNSGTIALSKVNVLMKNICNISDELKKNSALKINFSAVLEKQGKLKATFSLPLYNLNRPMIYSGSLSKMDLTKFNSILGPFLKMKIKRGQLNSLSFNVAAYPNRAKGTLIMNYSSLKLSVGAIKNKELVEGLGIEPLVNILVNSLLIKQDNPSLEKPLREGEIYFEPDKTRFVVHYWLNSIFTGIPESLGVSNKVRGKLKK